jgi:hypothetical protein
MLAMSTQAKTGFLMETSDKVIESHFQVEWFSGRPHFKLAAEAAQGGGGGLHVTSCDYVRLGEIFKRRPRRARDRAAPPTLSIFKAKRDFFSRARADRDRQIFYLRSPPVNGMARDL